MAMTISKDLLGKIVDEVFDGCCEDISAIEEIYRIVASHLTQPAQAVDVERQWREMFAIYVAGPMLYTDDGELSDATAAPAIDFLRDSADTIARKLADRARNNPRALSAEKAGWRIEKCGDVWHISYTPASPTPDKEG
jgi:hypothetical protein